VSARQEATAAELRELLEAVREAIDIPYASCAGEDDKRTAALKDRAMRASVILQRVLDEPEGMDYLRADTTFLRNQLADAPLDYVTHEESRERMARGVPYMEAVRGAD